MTPAQVIAIPEQAGVRLFVAGGRLRVRAAGPDRYTPDLRALVDAHRTELTAFLARPSPRKHFFSLADGYEDGGITGRRDGHGQPVGRCQAKKGAQRVLRQT